MLDKKLKVSYQVFTVSQLSLPIGCILISLSLPCSIHVVFGQVISGQDLVRQLEDLPIDRNSRPLQDAAIASCGELVKASKGMYGHSRTALEISIKPSPCLQLKKKRNAESVRQPRRHPTATPTSRRPSRSNAKRKRKPRRSVRTSTPSPATVKCK